MPVPKPSRLWQPKRLLATPSALTWEHGAEIAARATALGVPVTTLPSDRLKLDFPEDSRRAYAEAKATLALVVAPPSKRRLQPISPSADWRVDLAEGCPAHCGYCYLAGSLKGPPITRVYANLPEILAELPAHLGQGTVTSRSTARAHEGTTFEASCYTDPLGIEHVTGSLSALIAHFGAWEADVQLRFTTKSILCWRSITAAARGCAPRSTPPPMPASKAAPAPLPRGWSHCAGWRTRAIRSD
jgi:spore photoproduct lyase